jgi:hypothetical protein
MEFWTDTYREPALTELFDEPIIAALMDRDGVDRTWLARLIADKAERPVLADAKPTF